MAANHGVSPEALVRKLRPLVPAGVEVATGRAQVKAESKGSDEELARIQKFLLAFGGIALFVGAFVIFNTLSITIAQRTRELATLRTLGASRRQVLTSVVAESIIIGVLGSLAGLMLGLGLDRGLAALVAAAEDDLPDSGAVLSPRTVVVSLAVGIVITLVAGLLPALRATRVPPIAAVREGATLPPSPLARYIAADRRRGDRARRRRDLGRPVRRRPRRDADPRAARARLPRHVPRRGHDLARPCQAARRGRRPARSAPRRRGRPARAREFGPRLPAARRSPPPR